MENGRDKKEMTARVITGGLAGACGESRGITDRGDRMNRYFFGLSRIAAGPIISTENNVLSSEKTTGDVEG